MPVREDKDDIFARMALEKGWATAEQVREARQIQNRLLDAGLDRRVWEVCQDRGFIGSDKVEVLKRAIVREKGVRVRIAGYEILDRMGQGAMGQVFRARQLSVGRIVALKILSTDLSRDEAFVRRFQTEACLAARLDHPNVVRVLNFGEDAGRHYIAMEFVAGRSFRHLAERKGRLSPDRAAEVGAQAARGLAHAHSLGIAHRDVKPDNLLMGSDGQVKVGDLGLARERPDDASSSAPLAWTPAYAAPEQIRGEPCGPRADIYSLGATLFHLVTGRPPYDGDTEYQVLSQHIGAAPPSAALVCPDVPPWLDAVLRKMMAKDPADRYASMAEVEEELQSARCGRSPAALRRMPGHHVQERDTQRRRALLVAATGSLLLGLGLIAFLAQRRAAPPLAETAQHVLGGEVWSASANMPLANVKVSCATCGQGAETDRHGVFRLTCPPNFPHRLRLEREGYPPAGIVAEASTGTTWVGSVSMGKRPPPSDVQRRAFRVSLNPIGRTPGRDAAPFELRSHSPEHGTVALEAEDGMVYAGPGSLSHFVEAPAEGYRSRLDGLREGEVFFFRTEGGLYGKGRVALARGLDEALFHTALQASGSRRFPRGPSGLQARWEGDALRLVWREVAGADWHTVWRRPPLGPWERIGRVGGVTHLDRFTHRDSIYRYAVNAEGERLGVSDASEIVAFAGEPGVRAFEVSIASLPARVDLLGQRVVAEGGDAALRRDDRGRVLLRPALRAEAQRVDALYEGIESAPLGGYSPGEIELARGAAYVLRTADGRYAKFRARVVAPLVELDFTLQPDGSRVFEGAPSSP